MKKYYSPEIELTVLRTAAVLTMSDETDIINPYGESDTDSVDA